MSNSPILWGPNNIANNLENQIQNSDGSILADTGPYNYVRNATFDQSISVPSGPSLQTVTLTSGVPTGAPSAGAAQLVLSQDTTTQLLGVGSLQMTVATAWTSGQGFALPSFTVQKAHLGKVLTFSFYYNALSGGANINWSGLLASQTAQIWIYDVTAAAWVQPTGYLGMNQNSGTGVVTGTFQSSVVSGQQYQLFIFAGANTGGPITIDFDQFYIGPQTSPIGAAITQPIAYTPTFTNFGTMSAVFATWQRIGNSVRVVGNCTTGTLAGAIGSISLPPGLSIDTTLILANNTSGFGTKVGDARGNAANAFAALVTATSTSTTVVYTAAAVSNTAQLVPSNANNAFQTAAPLSFEFTVPVAGWNSNVQLSSDTDTRVISARAWSSSGQSFTSGATTTVVYNNISFDTSGSYNTTTGIYTVPVSGKYKVYGKTIWASASMTAANYFMRAVKNGTAMSAKTNQQVTTATQILCLDIYSEIDCIAGDQLLVDATQNAGAARTLTTGSTDNEIIIERLSGPSVIAAADSVNMRVNGSATTLVANTAATVVWTNRDFDSSNAMNMATGIYTMPISGKFQHNVNIQVTGVIALNSQCTIDIQKSTAGGSFTTISEFQTFAGGAMTAQNGQVSDTLSAIAGDQFRIQVTSGATGPGISTTAARVFWSLERIGN